MSRTVASQIGKGQRRVGTPMPLLWSPPPRGNSLMEERPEFDEPEPWTPSNFVQGLWQLPEGRLNRYRGDLLRCLVGLL